MVTGVVLYLRDVTPQKPIPHVLFIRLIQLLGHKFQTHKGNERFNLFIIIIQLLSQLAEFNQVTDAAMHLLTV